MLSSVQRPAALSGSPNLRTSDYFILTAACFAAEACCFFWFAAFALICFCAACLCTAFGDLSPIISLPFGCWFTDPQQVHFSESDWNRELHPGCCQFANVATGLAAGRTQDWSADSHVRAFLAAHQVRADKAVRAPVSPFLESAQGLRKRCRAASLPGDKLKGSIDNDGGD